MRPHEVDEVAQRTWKTVYDGNYSDTNRLITAVTRRYAHQIYTDATFQLEPISGPALKTACCNAKHSAAGVDAFSPEDFTYLSDATFAWLADLLNDIEAGAPWPKDLLVGKAAFLSKNLAKTEDALSYRVLLILPVLYRRWASTRLNDLRPWVRRWQLEGMFAGTESVGAEDAWFDTALHLELYRVTNTPYSGSAADIYKCFDQVSRPL